MGHNAIRVEPLTPSIGAVVHGVDLTRSIDDPTIEAIHKAWMQHLVLFFRDQALSREQLTALGQRFGELHTDLSDLPGYPGIMEVHTNARSKAYAGRRWHSDFSCYDAPPAGSILHLHRVPASGGDTLFANMYAAFDTLSEPMQVFLSGLRVVHSAKGQFDFYYNAKIEDLPGGKYPEAVHPVVRSHSVTGRKVLFVNETYTSHIEGLPRQESRALLNFLYRHIRAERFHCRFRWAADSIAMWDNRCTQHMAMWDYYPDTRSGYRVAIASERPA